MTLHDLGAPGRVATQLAALFLGAVLIAVLASAEARGQDTSLNIPDAFKNSVGIGVGGGFSYSSDAPNFTISMDYNRAIAGPWGITVAVGWDKEFRKRDGKRTHSQAFDLSVGMTYALTERIGLAAGFSRGLIGKEEGESWKSAGTNDWGVGAAISYSYPLSDKVFVGPGFVMAYDIDNSELRSEFDISISLAF